MTRHHQDGNPRRRFILQKPLANLVSAQIGQAVIEQNQVG
jgi:hypothetical protein